MVARNILEHGLGEGELLNVNLPAKAAADPAEIDLTRMGKRVYQDKLLERLDPRGTPYYWFGGPPPTGVAEPGTDFHAVVHGQGRHHAHPARPHGQAAAQAPPRLGVATRTGPETAE